MHNPVRQLFHTFSGICDYFFSCYNLPCSQKRFYAPLWAQLHENEVGRIMTRPIKLSFGSEVQITRISNIFIDEYMADANGSYVKVYIYLLRCLGDPSMSFSVASLSDKLDETEKDIIKALKYWEKKKLLYISWDQDGQIGGITINPLSNQIPEDNIVMFDPEPVVEKRTTRSNSSRKIEVAASEALIPEPKSSATKTADTPVYTKPSYTASQITVFKQYDDFNTLIDYIEDKLGCTMKLSDLQTPAFIYEQLGLPVELIRFLYDYCIFKDKKNNSYIEKVAISWTEKGIDTVEKARAEVFSRSKECSAVKSAFGISRNFGELELEFIDRWRIGYGMSVELIKEACNRTLIQTGKPSFTYADSILEGWHKAGASSVDDIAGLDQAHSAASKASASAAVRRTQTSGANKFNQYPQRTYSSEDYDSLVGKKLGDF